MFKRETNLGECCAKTGFLEASFVRVRAWEGDFAKESGADAVGRHWDAYSSNQELTAIMFADDQREQVARRFFKTKGKI